MKRSSSDHVIIWKLARNMRWNSQSHIQRSLAVYWYLYYFVRPLRRLHNRIPWQIFIITRFPVMAIKIATMPWFMNHVVFVPPYRTQIMNSYSLNLHWSWFHRQIIRSGVPQISSENKMISERLLVRLQCKRRMTLYYCNVASCSIIRELLISKVIFLFQWWTYFKMAS